MVDEDVIKELKEEIEKEIEEEFQDVEIVKKKVKKAPAEEFEREVEKDKLEEVEEKVTRSKVPIAPHLFSVSTNVEMFLANLQQQIINQAQEIHMLKKLLTKTIEESQAKDDVIDILSASIDSSKALAKLALDKLTLMMAYAIESGIRIQDLAVRYAETSQMNVALTQVLDEIRAKLVKYVPKEEIERLDELISLLSRAYRIAPIQRVVEKTKGE